MSNPMQKTMKMGNRLPMKSSAVRCKICDKLMRIEKHPPDNEKTEVQHVICYECRRKEKDGRASSKNLKS